MACGILTKRLPQDDEAPCGTRLWFIVDKRTVREDILLCKKCEEKNGEND